MVARAIVYDLQAQRSILRGVDALANAVAVTLGPAGRNVVLEAGGEGPRFTKDGVTVALEVEVSDRFENMGAELVRQVASLTAAAAGDGTSTAIVLAQGICREGLKLVAAGHDAMALKRGLERAQLAVSAELARLSRPLRGREEGLRVATLAANGDSAIGQLVVATLEEVGRHGVVSVVDGEHVETTLQIVRGLQFDRGFLSPYFVTDAERVECVLEDAWVLVSDRPVTGPAQLYSILEAALESKKPLLIIAEAFSEEALATLVVNKLRGNLPVCAVKCPSLGATRLQYLRDIALVTGASIVSEEAGLTLDRLRLEHLGRCQRIVVQTENTTLIGGHGDADAVARHAEQVRRQLDLRRADKRAAESELKELQLRADRLSQGVAIVRVGGHSRAELQERKDRIEDAVCATRLALDSGVLPGGGVALLRCRGALADLEQAEPELRAGIGVLRRSLSQPLQRIAKNAGADGREVAERVSVGSGWFGFDAARREFSDLGDSGVLDATKVVQSALECAVNVSALMLTTRAMVADKLARPPSFTPYRPDLFGDEDDDY